MDRDQLISKIASMCEGYACPPLPDGMVGCPRDAPCKGYTNTCEEHWKAFLDANLKKEIKPVEKEQKNEG